MKLRIRKLVALGFVFVVSVGVLVSCEFSPDRFFQATDPGNWDYLFTMNNSTEVSYYAADGGCGSSITYTNFALQGTGSLILGTPSSGAEAKFRTVLTTNSLLSKWQYQNHVVANVYVPAGCNVNKAFLGMFYMPYQWIEGVTYSGGLQVGWNQVVFNLLPKMKNVQQPSGGTNVYIVLTFWYQNGTNKFAMNQAIYVNGIGVPQ